MSSPKLADSGLAGGVAIVTGGSRGIGRAIAAAFHAEGASVILTDLDAPRGQAAQAVGYAEVILDMKKVEKVQPVTNTKPKWQPIATPDGKTREAAESAAELRREVGELRATLEAFHQHVRLLDGLLNRLQHVFLPGLNHQCAGIRRTDV